MNRANNLTFSPQRGASHEPPAPRGNPWIGYNITPRNANRGSPYRLDAQE